MTKSRDEKKGGVAFAKRAKISKAQQMMLLAICGASVVLGVTLVGVVYLVKVIRFNMTLISAKDESISGFVKVQGNLKSMMDKIGDLASNETSEVMARNRTESNDCKNFKEEGFEYSLENINSARTCSALRVIPDALPSWHNGEATASSLDYLTKDSKVNLKAISVDEYSYHEIPQEDNLKPEETITANTTEINLTAEDNITNISNMFDSIEHSIRNFDAINVMLSYTGDYIARGDGAIVTLNSTFVTYYTDPQTIQIKTKMICANEDSNKCTASGSKSSSKSGS